MLEGKLNIVTALSCEARIFLDKYRMSKIDNPSRYSIFADSERRLHLIISGIGKIRSAAAMSFLHAFSQSPPHTCYLNAGIAGHQTQAIGHLFLAHKITDAANNKNYYPFPILIESLAGMPILTVDKPTAVYPDQALADMEAAGFFSAGISLVFQEQIQAIKIVSDNMSFPFTQVNAAHIVRLFERNIFTIEKIVDFLLNFSARESQPLENVISFNHFTEKFHVTHYQKHQLSELLRRWHIHFPEKDPREICAQEKNIEDAMTLLTHNLAQVRLCS